MITIKSELKDYAINLPTNLTELNSDTLDIVTSHIRIPKHYCIVALAFNTNIFNLVTSVSSNNNNNTMSVVPILAKAYDEDLDLINAKIGDKVVIERSSIERATHININTVINSNNIRNYFTADSKLCRKLITGTEKIIYDIHKHTHVNAKEVDNVIVFEFKIVPIVDIKAAIPVNVAIIDPFKCNSDDNC